MSQVVDIHSQIWQKHHIINIIDDDDLSTPCTIRTKQCKEDKCHKDTFNSLAPGKFEWNLIQVIFKLILATAVWGISIEIALR